MRVLAIYIVILFTNITSAQDFDLGKNNPNPNSVQLDIGSFDLFYSLHYERIILNRNKFSTAGRVGISYLRATFGTKHIYIPLEINEIYSLKNHHIEIGLGYIMNSDVSLVRNIGFTLIDRLTGRIGYRYQKPGGKAIFRVGYTPFLYHYANSEENFLTAPKEYHNSYGVSIGYCF